jgi:hypothetical protein
MPDARGPSPFAGPVPVLDEVDVSVLVACELFVLPDPVALEVPLACAPDALLAPLPEVVPPPVADEPEPPAMPDEPVPLDAEPLAADDEAAPGDGPAPVWPSPHDASVTSVAGTANIPTTSRHVRRTSASLSGVSMFGARDSIWNRAHPCAPYRHDGTIQRARVPLERRLRARRAYAVLRTTPARLASTTLR